MTIVMIRPMEPGTGASPESLPVIPGNGEADTTRVLSAKRITEFLVNPAVAAPIAELSVLDDSFRDVDTSGVRIRMTPTASPVARHGRPGVVAAAVLVAGAFTCLAWSHHTSDGTPAPALAPTATAVPAVSADDSSLIRIVPVSGSKPLSLAEAVGMAAVVAP